MDLKVMEEKRRIIKRITCELLSVMYEKMPGLESVSESKMNALELGISRTLERESFYEKDIKFRDVKNTIIILIDHLDNFLCSTGYGKYYLSETDIFQAMKFHSKEEALKIKKAIFMLEGNGDFKNLLPKEYSVCLGSV